MYGKINGKRVNFDPQKSVGKGGEADIYNLENGMVAKIFKPPNHPDYQDEPTQQKGAEFRINEHQRKLANFPKGLPASVIVPQELVTDSNGSHVIGYTMKFVTGAELLLNYSQQDFRQLAGIGNGEVAEIFFNLHATVAGIHQVQNMVIGDFNDLNALVLGKQVYLIDADSYDFGEFRCRVFTQKFVDPLLCSHIAKGLCLSKPYNANSDWYAYAVMLMQSLLFVDPYGGVYLPKDHSKRIPYGQRPFKRITVFDPEVRYPKAAVPYGLLPDDLLHFFHNIFAKDERGTFPANLLANFRWTTCTKCGTEHGRSMCPQCSFAAPAAIREVTRIFGKVMVTRVFTTTGAILHSTVQNGRLLWVYHEGGQFKRENRESITPGALDRGLRFRICGTSTIVGKNNQLVTLSPGQAPVRNQTQTYGSLPVFDTNRLHTFWIENGRLVCSNTPAPDYLGDVLEGQTLFWTGENLGFGFYRAGQISVAFVFRPGENGLYDQVKLPALRGQIVDAYCLFSQSRAWLFVQVRDSGKSINHCVVINQDGKVEAQTSAEQGAGGWLSDLRGKCVSGKNLLVPTDDGVVRVALENGQLTEVESFPDTESLIDSNCQLQVGADGLYVVKGKEILLLKITR